MKDWTTIGVSIAACVGAVVLILQGGFRPADAQVVNASFLLCGSAALLGGGALVIAYEYRECDLRPWLAEQFAGAGTVLGLVGTGTLVVSWLPELGSLTAAKLFLSASAVLWAIAASLFCLALRWRVLGGPSARSVSQP